jgi:vacuolar-type H+-ATPase subunit I/STV1
MSTYTLIAQELLVEINGIIEKVKSNVFKNTNVNSVMFDVTAIQNTIKNTQQRYLAEIGEFPNNPVIPPISKMDAELQRIRNRKNKQNQLLKNLENQKKKHQNELNRIKAMSNLKNKQQSILALINGLRRNIGNNNRN